MKISGRNGLVIDVPESIATGLVAAGHCVLVPEETLEPDAVTTEPVEPIVVQEEVIPEEAPPVEEVPEEETTPVEPEEVPEEEPTPVEEVVAKPPKRTRKSQTPPKE